MLLFESELCQEPASGLDTATKNLTGCRFFSSVAIFCMQGNAAWHGNRGAGHGPWVGADLEAGMYYGGGGQTIVNNQSTALTSDFVSLHLKGRTDGL